MSEATEQTIVINDLLSFISCKIKLFPRERFIKCLKEFYSEGAAIEAEKTLAASLPDNVSLVPKGKNEKNIFSRLCKSFLLVPEEELPIFVCKNLNNVPKLETDEEESQDDDEDDDNEDLINEQKFIKAQIAEISSVVYQLKDQIQLLAVQRSKNKSSDDLSSKKRKNLLTKDINIKAKQVVPKKNKPLSNKKSPKGLAYLQTLIDQEEEEKVKRLSVKQEPSDDIFSDIDEKEGEDDEEENDSLEDEDDDNTLQLIANRRQRALVKNMESEVLNGKKVSEPLKRGINFGSFKRKASNSNEDLSKISRRKINKNHDDDEDISDHDDEYKEAFGLDDEDEELDLNDVDEKESGRKRSGLRDKSHINVEEVFDENVGTFSIYKCTLCNFSTNDEAAIERHDCPQLYCGSEDEDVSNTFKYFCFECKFRGNNRALFKKHLLKHPQFFSCPICPEKVGDSEEWPEHVRDCIENENLRPENYICNVCDVIYASANAIRVHRSNHEPNKPFECLVCKFRFQTSEKLDSHFKLHQNKGYKCPFCFYVHKNKYTFFTHIRSHTGETPFACSLCDYRSTSLTAVNAHMLTHSNKKVLECDVCHSRFKSNQKLNTHKKIHQKAGEHKCPECDKSFKTAWLLTAHHTSEHIVPHTFPCQICDFTADSTSALKIHMSSHEKVQIFNCSLCTYRTNYRTQLDEHLKKTHLGLE